MKHLVFWTVFLFGIPAIAFFYAGFERFRGFLITALITSVMLGSRASINYVSMEFYRGPDRGFEVTLADILVLGIIAGMILSHMDRIKWIPGNTVLMALFFTVSTIGLVQSNVMIFGLFTLFKFGRVYLLYWCLVNVVRTNWQDKAFKDAVWLSLVIVGGYIGFVAFKQKYMMGIYRIPATFDHSNTVPLYLNLILPVTLAWALTAPGLSKIKALISTGAVFAMLFAVVATMSRAGMALSVLCLSSVMMLSLIRKPNARSCSISVVASVCLLAGGFMAMDSIIDRFLNAPEASEEARDEFNVAAKMMAEDHLLGVGINNFSDTLTNNHHYREHVKVMANEEQAGVAHHIYLLTAAETGYFGLVIFVLILIRFLMIFLFNGWRSKGFEGQLLVAIAIGHVALHTSGFLEWAFRITPVMYQYAIVTGLGIGLKSWLDDQKKQSPSHNH